ncbi:MAG TPA: hypothetical protein VGR81_12820 [Candidatus Acidoferrales bacterium]|nr:hypothetical protein [Candidatus Acidoferrales bacterium]
MPTAYTIDKTRRLVLSSASGVVTKAELVTHRRALTRDPDFDPNYSQIMDFSEVTDVDVEASDIRDLAIEHVFSTTSRRAIIARTSAVYGLARLFEIHRDMRGERGIRVFRDREEAFAWVSGKEEKNSD